MEKGSSFDKLRTNGERQTPFDRLRTNGGKVKKVVRIAVRSLVEQMYRSGSLGAEFVSTERAVEGIAGHKKLRKSRPEGYRTEVPVAYRLDTPFSVLELTGRIDGVDESSETVVIEELKTTTRDPDEVAAEENPVHWGQLKLYAWCYAVEHELEQVAGQLTYYHIDSGISREVRQRVWTRYGGRCAECGADDYLEFDHVIPVAKGGSNTDANVQLLCRRCNLNKRDNI